MSCECNDKVFENKLGSIACSSTGKLVDRQLNLGDCEEDLIEIRGVSSPIDLDRINTGTTWTQIFIPEVLCIPTQKPDVEQVMTISARVDIISKKVVRTPAVTVENYEGTILTGRKLIIEGILKQKIIYTADVAQQSVHSAHFDVPFSTFIVLPVDTPLITKYKVEPYIEDIFVCRVTDRQIFKNVTLFIKATELTC